MAPPSGFDYLSTRNQVIQGALETVGAREAEQAPTASMLAQALRVLQQMVKAWTNKNIYLWDYEESSILTIVGTSEYNSSNSAVTDNIMAIDAAWVVSSSERIPLEVISWARYQDLPDRDTATGRPTTVTMRMSPEPQVYFYPVPDDAYQVKVNCVFSLSDLDDAGTCGDFTARFQEALEYNLADRLFDKYPGPATERAIVSTKAKNMLDEAINFKVVNETTDEVEGFYGCRR